jgi:hypothetical protein
MAATIDTVPYDMLAELGHSYNPMLISCAMILRAAHADARDYVDAYDLASSAAPESGPRPRCNRSGDMNSGRAFMESVYALHEPDLELLQRNSHL